MSQLKNICICLPSAKVYSETFIQAHVDHLSAKTIDYGMLPSVIEHEGAGAGLAGIKQRVRKAYTYIENRKKEKALSRFFKKESIGIMLAEYGHIGAGVLETCKKNNIPLVVHFHGFDAYKKETLKKYEKQYAELFSYAKAIVVVSRDMEKQLLSIGAPQSKLNYIVYGVDISKFPQSPNVSSSKQLLFVGRFVEKKAPYLALMAFKKALEKVPDAKFHMVGDGLLWDVCKNMAVSLKISDSVIMPGALSHSDIASLMQSSRAYVQHSIVPSSGDSEGTPNSILEAQASGLPVISTRHGGITDVVIHGKTGFLCDEGDIDEMASHMIKLLTEPGLASEMGISARKYAVENYAISDSISKLRTILINNINS